MVDLREYSDDLEETLRVAIRGELKRVFTAMPVIVSKSSKDGHTTQLKMSIRGQVITKEGKKQKVDITLLDDVPVHYAGGGSVTLTHPITEKDEGLAVFLSRPQDTWHQSGDVQDPIDNRVFSLSDARYLPGGRSDPRKIKNVSDKAAHLRSDDGKHTFEQHPEKGMTAKSVHPDDKAEDPFKDAKKYHAQSVIGEVGYLNESVDGDKKHSHSLDYENGHALEANNGKHNVKVHPDSGSSISADDGDHKVEAKSGEGVKLTSSEKVKVDAPQTEVSQNLSVGNLLSANQASFSVAAIGALGGLAGGAMGGNSMGGNAGTGGVGAGGMAANAAANNVGSLGGDLGGTLPNPTVVSLLHISNAHQLTNATDDTAAAAAGVAVGHLYRTGSTLKVRIA